jgi:hypothetical protein
MSNDRLSKEWRELVARLTAKLEPVHIYLPTSEARGIAAQSGDNWEAGDRAVAEIEHMHFVEKSFHLKRLAQWTPPEDANNMADLIDAGIAYLWDHEDARQAFPLALEMITNALKNERESLENKG